MKKLGLVVVILSISLFVGCESLQQFAEESVALIAEEQTEKMHADMKQHELDIKAGKYSRKVNVVLSTTIGQGLIEDKAKASIREVFGNHPQIVFVKENNAIVMGEGGTDISLNVHLYLEKFIGVTSKMEVGEGLKVITKASYHAIYEDDDEGWGSRDFTPPKKYKALGETTNWLKFEESLEMAAKQFHKDVLEVIMIEKISKELEEYQAYYQQQQQQQQQ